MSIVFLKKRRLNETPEIKELLPEKEFDFRKAAISMLKEAKKLFNKKLHKDAYGKSSEAVRFYYSYKFGMNKEMTNTELLKHLRMKGLPSETVQKWIEKNQVEYLGTTEDVKSFIGKADCIVLPSDREGSLISGKLIPTEKSCCAKTSVSKIKDRSRLNLFI